MDKKKLTTIILTRKSVQTETMTQYEINRYLFATYLMQM